MKNLTIGKRITFGFASILLIALLASLFTLLNGSKVSQGVTLNKERFDQLSLFSDFRYRFKNVTLAYMDAIVDAKSGRVDEDIIKTHQDLKKFVEDSRAKFIAAVDTDQEKENLEKILKDTAVFLQAGEALLKAISDRAGQEEMNKHDNIIDSLGDIVSNLIAANVTSIQNEYSESSDELYANNQNNVKAQWISLFVILVFGIVFALIITKQIAKNIALFVGMTRRITDSVGQGDLSVRANKEGLSPEFMPIIDGINSIVEEIVRPIRMAMEIMSKVSTKDLSAKFEGEYQGDFLRFKENINTAVANLRDTIEHVKIASQQVYSGSDQVAKASQTLSQGATEQAASLEEISSSVKEIGAQSEHNAGSASQAQSIGLATQQSAEEGAKLMKDLVEAMNQINQSSETISKIIRVIDEIAFQTNLLALNAAVEAARAGRHGKGFAVVAEEVRNLAERSAKAAKETTEMIEDSSRKVSAGSQIAESTSESLGQILKGVTQVSTLVSEISRSSNEQAESVLQVSKALGQIDQVTQGNAASAEESAAASRELAGQSQSLLDQVNVFRI